jgi:DNA modification methylase
MQNALGNASGCDTQLILSSAEKCVRESKHMLTELLKRNPVNCAEIQRLTNIITTTQDLLSTDGFVDLATSSNMLRSWAVGEADSLPRFKYCSKASKKERGPGNDHATVKPLDLMKYLLTLASTPTGGVILDPFAGSGTTLIAAKELGRPCIGVELDAHHCEIAVTRLNSLNRCRENEGHFTLGA